MDRFILLLASLLIAGTISCSRQGPQTPPDVPATEPGALTGSTIPPATVVDGRIPTAPVDTKSVDENSTSVAAKAAFGDVLTVPPDADLASLAVELVPSLTWEAVRNTTPPVDQNQVGDLETFWLIDLVAEEAHRPEFELRSITEHADWYVQAGLAVPQVDLAQAASFFEKEVYPRVVSTFGKNRHTGENGGPRLTILNADIRGAGGYFSSDDTQPSIVAPFSNHREIIYINAAAIPPGGPSYQEVIAHELSHAIHWRHDPTEEAWVNEGLAEYAITAIGAPLMATHQFLRTGPVSLVHWPYGSSSSVANYGGASLFIHYLLEHYPSKGGPQTLMEQPENGVAGVTAYLRKTGYDVAFRGVFKDWVVANFLDQPEGKYGYAALQAKLRVRKIIADFSEYESSIPQYSVQYIDLSDFSGPVRVRFQGQTETPLLPTEAGPQGCWWSNSGDSINSTLTASLDLRGLSRAALSYKLWYDIEEGWDYAYVAASLDGGAKWSILNAPGATAEDPFGKNFGAGYTGNSGGWTTESVDLSKFAGEQVLLRFQYVTDDAANGMGLCLRQAAVTSANSPQPIGDWQPQGFVLTSNRVPQDYIVQVIEVSAEPRVTTVPLDENNEGRFLVERPEDLERLVVAVAAVAPKTRQRAAYTLFFEPPGNSEP